MYISRLYINTARTGAQRLVGSPYRMHAAVEAAFPPGANRATEQGRILWRLDALASDRQALALYVVSPERPDLTHIVEQAGWPGTTGWETRDYTPLIERIGPGQHWNFRLKANPTRKVAEDKGRVPREGVVGSIQGHATPEQQLGWLADRGAANGFSLASAPGSPTAVVTQSRKERFRRGKSEVTLSTAVFDGVLRVEDAGLFRRALCHGIGRAKGFGCGLITVAPVEARWTS